MGVIDKCEKIIDTHFLGLRANAGFVDRLATIVERAVPRDLGPLGPREKVHLESVFALRGYLGIYENIFDLVGVVVSHFVDIQFTVLDVIAIVDLLVSKIARLTIWAGDMNIQVTARRPGEAKSNRVLIGQATSSSSSFELHGTVLSLNGRASSLIEGDSCLLLVLLRQNGDGFLDSRWALDLLEKEDEEETREKHRDTNAFIHSGLEVKRVMVDSVNELALFATRTKQIAIKKKMWRIN